MRTWSSHRVLLIVLCATIAFLAASLWSTEVAQAAARNPKGVAVIVGNKDYRHRDIPAVSFAHRDADAFRRYVVDVLGFEPKNIIDLRDATRAQFLHTFGRRKDEVSDLWAKLLPDREWDVVVFYSGHGVPGLTDGKGYLLPVDVPPGAAQEEGYPLEQLYEKLGSLSNARSVQVYLESCFSGASDGGPLVRSASPVVVRPALPKGLAGKVTAVSASGADQIASWDVKARHGLFTHHLLDALYGKGDADGDNRVTAKEVEAYLDGYMTRAAWLQHRRKQNANVLGAAGMVLASAPPGGFPKRPSLDSGTGVGKKDETKTEEVAKVAKPAVVEKEAVLDREKRKLVQRGLASFGLYKGFVDGIFGPKTSEAIRAWQKAKGFRETGKLTKDQADGLVAVSGEAQREKAERERKTREAARRERLEKETRERAKAEREAREAAEFERRAKETRERVEAERKAREKAERERELERKAKEAAERERKAREEAERERARMKFKPLQRKWPKGKRLRDCPECPELVVDWKSNGKPIAVSQFITVSEWVACLDESFCSKMSVGRLLGKSSLWRYETSHKQYRHKFQDSHRKQSAEDKMWLRFQSAWKIYVKWLLRKTNQVYRIHRLQDFSLGQDFACWISRDLK